MRSQEQTNRKSKCMWVVSAGYLVACPRWVHFAWACSTWGVLVVGADVAGIIMLAVVRPINAQTSACEAPACWGTGKSACERSLACGLLQLSLDEIIVSCWYVWCRHCSVCATTRGEPLLSSVPSHNTLLRVCPHIFWLKVSDVHVADLLAHFVSHILGL